MRLSVLFILVLGATQASEAKASESSPIGEAGQTYEVRPRDRLERVAAHFGVTIGEIISANPPRAFIRECVGRRELTLKNGETITVCRRVHYGLIAGKTLVIPVPRLIVESENVRLDAENTALEAERDQAERESDLLKQERDALRDERDTMSLETKATLLEMAELQARYDELAQAGATTPATSSAEETNGDSQNQPATYSREGFLAVIVMFLCGALFIGALALYRYLDIRSKKAVPGPSEKMRKAKEELGRIRQEREDLDATRRSLVKEGEELAERRRRLDADDLEIRTQRLALERDQESLRTQRDELGKWEESLKARAAVPVSEKPKTVTAIGVPPIFPPVPTGGEKAKTEVGLLQVMVARGQQLLEIDFRTLVGREAACTAREKAIERRAAALDSLRQALEDRERNLTEKEHGVEELRRTFSSGKARCDLTDIAQTEREENLVKGFADLKTQQERAYGELDTKRSELDRRASEIDAKIRMYDEDIAPAIKKSCEELTEREQRLVETERSNVERAEKLSEDERAYERRLRELNDAAGALDERAEKLGEGERKLNEEQNELRNSREAFANEVDAAKSILTRAKRKREITEALDRRESAVAGKEREFADLAQKLDDRAADLNTWEERLKDKAHGLGVADEDDDATRQVLPLPSFSDGSITHLDFAEPGSGPSSGGGTGSGSGLAIGVELYTCAVCNQTMDAAEIEAHKAVCPKTARHVKTISPPAATLLPESFYCNSCLAIVASTEDEYRAHQKKHKDEEAVSEPKVLGEDRAEAPSRFVCPQCGKSVDWEEIETHKCVL